MRTHYHGGKFTAPYIIGFNITDDDGNSNFINEVRKYKEEDFIEGFNIFKKDLLIAIEDDINTCKIDNDSESLEWLDKFKDVVLNTAPEFYSVEVSS